jgi:hypothetical protein
MNACRRGNRRAVLVVVASLLASLALDSACAKPPDVSFQVTLPASLAGDAAFYVVGAFPNGECPNSAELEGGVPVLGPVARLVFAANDSNPPAFGDLPKASYGFAAVALSTNCSIIAEGCSSVNVGSANAVSIELSAITDPAGACESGTMCSDAVCVPAADGGASGCSLTLVGGGPLADPLVNPVESTDTTLLSPPAIAATGSGFLIAYREFDQDTGSARLTVLPIDDVGASSAPQQTMLEGRCQESPETDAAAIAWSGSSGVVALARQACPASSAGVDLYAVNASGATMSNGFSATEPGAVQLSQGHALAYTPAGLLLATVDSKGTASVTPVTGVSLGPSTSTTSFGGLTSVVGAYVTGTTFGTGLLSLGTGKSGGDREAGAEAGAEGGTEAGFDAGVPSDEDCGLPLHTWSLTNVPSSGSLSALPASYDQPGSWVSLSAVDGRLLVATNGPAASPIQWSAFDFGAVMPAVVGNFAPEAMGSILYSDVALHADNAFFAVAVADSIALLAFRKASTSLEPVTEVDFANDSRIPIDSIRDGLVAVAADDTRVAVVWGTGRSVSTLEDLGGYAVFACVP